MKNKFNFYTIDLISPKWFIENFKSNSWNKLNNEFLIWKFIRYYLKEKNKRNKVVLIIKEIIKT